MLKNILKRTLSTILVLTIVATTFSIIEIVEPTSVLPTASASTKYNKVYAGEYYGTATTFIGYLAVGRAPSGCTSSTDQAKSPLSNAGYTVIDKDLNDGAGGAYVYMGYMTTTSTDYALRKIAFYSGSAPMSASYGGYTYYLVGQWNNSEINTISKKDKYASGVQDLNNDAGGRYIYMYATRDSAAGGPITSVSVNDSSSGAAVWMNSVDVTAGGAADLNDGAGGDDIFLHYSTSFTSVNTSTLRTYMNTQDDLVSTNYTSTWDAVTTAMTTAKNITDDYNNDGISKTYDGTAITNAATALNTALTGLYTRITVDANGGKINGNNSTTTDIKCGTSTTVNFPTGNWTPSRDGYTFKGWSTNKNASSGTENGNISVGLMGTVYATWKANTYTVTLDPKRYTSSSDTTGTAPTSTNHSTSVTATFNSPLPAITAPTMTGYNFGGYYATKLGSGTQYHNANGTATSNKWTTADTGKIYAKWTAKTMTVTLDSKRYTSTSDTTGTAATTAGDTSVTGTYASAMPNITTPTLTGYEFGGYFITKTGTGAQYYKTNGTSNQNWDKESATTLYAKWTAIGYKISYAGGGTLGTNAPTTATYDQAFEVSAPSQSGYTFAGWKATSGLNTSTGKWGKTSSPSTAMTASTVCFNTATTSVYFKNLTDTKNATVTLTAQWTKNKYTITINPDGGKYNGATGNTSLTNQEYGSTITIGPATDKAGYSFAGWSKTSGQGTYTAGSPASSGGTFTVGAGIATLKASWTANKYKVTLDSKLYASADAATGTAATTAGTTEVAQQAYDAAMTAITPPTLSGYTFGGYYDGKTGTGTQYYNADGSSARTWNKTSNTTLYAQWTINQYYLDLNGWLDGGNNGNATGNISGYGTADVYIGSSVSNDITDYYAQSDYGTSYEIKDIKASKGHRYVGLKSGSLSGTIPANNTAVVLEFATNSYTIAYNGNGNTGGSAPASHTGVYYNDPSSKGFTTSVTTNANSFTKTGYVFNKWNTKADGSGTSITAGSGTVSAKTLVDLLSTDPGNGGTVYLYATWTVQSYKVTLDSKLYASENSTSGTDATTAGTTEVASQQFDAAMTAITPPTRTGYDFDGYWDGKTGTGTQYYKTDGTSNHVWDKGSNTTLYAKWTIHTSTLKVAPNGGNWKYNNVTYTTTQTYTKSYGDTMTIPNPTRTGWTFSGWTRSGNTTNGTWSGGVFTFGAASGTETTLTAGWTRNTSTLKIDPNSGTWNTFTTTQTYTRDSGTTLDVPDPTRTGYNFGGWNRTGDNNGTLSNKVYTFGNANGKTDTLTAIWNAKTYTMSFDKNGGTWAGWANDSSVTATTKTISFGSQLGVADSSGKTWPNNPTAPTGYTFVKWTSNGTASGTTYQNTTVLSAESGIATKAYYRINTSTLTVAPNSGSWTYGGQTYTSSHDVTGNYNTTVTIPDPSRTGYDFAGWTKSGSSNGTWNATNKTFQFGATDNTTTTLTANWTIHTSKLTVKPNSGKWTYGGVEYTADHTITGDYNTTITIPDPSRTGYTFSGWTEGGSGGTWNATAKTFKFGATKDAVKTLTASWTANKYTVTLDPKYYSSAGATGAAVTSNGTTSVTEQEFNAAMKTITAPTYTGYDFDGYWSGITGTGTQYYKTDGTSNHVWDKANSTTTLYAKWNIHSSTLTVDPAGGTWGSSTATQDFTENYKTTKAIADPSRTGYDFAGWTLSSGANGSFANGTYTFGPAKNTTDTLTATWTAHTSTLKIKPNGGTWNGSTAEKTYTKAYTETQSIPDPTQNGYSFSGWSRTGAGNGSWNSTSKVYTFGPTAGVTDTFTAGWTPLTYTVTLNSARYASATATSGTAADNAGTTSVTATFGSAMPAITIPTMTGYDFGGYWDGKTGTGTQYYTDAGASERSWNKYPSSQQAELFAKWTAHTYTINYTLNGGSVATANPQGYTIETATFTLNNATKSGYTFKGWQGDGNAPADPSTSVQITQGSTGNLWFVAVFETIQYTIKYYDDDGTTELTGLTPNSYNIETPNFNLPTATKNGYDFSQWTGGTSVSGTDPVSQIAKGSTGNRYFKAHWTPKTYTVTLDSNLYASPTSTSGTAATSAGTGSVTATFAAAMPTSGVTMPTRNGYDFGGYWDGKTGTGNMYYKADGTSNRNWDKYPASGTATLYAKWTATGYTITFTLNDDANAPASLSQTLTDNKMNYNTTQSTTIPSATRGGYTFGGWKPSATAGNWNSGSTYAAGTSVNGKYGSPTLVAQWTKETYEITFDMTTYGGSLPSGQANPMSYTVEDTNKVLPNATKTGYNFTGWTPTANEGSWLTGSTYAKNTNLQGKWGTVTLRPQFTAKTFTLTFSLNGGDLTETYGGFTAHTDNQTKTVTYDKSYNTTKNGKSWPKESSLTKTGYTFTGWYIVDDSDNLTNTRVQGSDTVNILKTTTIRAKWDTVGYTITCDPNGGAYASGVTQYTGYNIESADITLKDPTRAGYTFDGWKGVGNEPSEATKPLVIAQGSTGNRSYEACWTPVTYTIKYYDTNGTTQLTGLSPTSYNIETPDFNLPEPTKNGYSFKGWTGMSVTTATKPFEVPVGTTGNLNFTAHWDAKNYTVSLDKNGGTGGSSSTTATYNAAMVDITKPSKTGWTFLGYYKTAQSSDANHTSTKYYDADGHSAHVWDQTVASPKIYAHWTKTRYTITYSACNTDDITWGSTNAATNPNPGEYYVDTAEFTLTNPNRRGYTFKGWTGTGIAQQTTTVTVPTNSTGNREYTAQWEIIEYTITYNYNIRPTETAPSNPATFTVTTPRFKLTNPSKGGYTFKGWSGDAATGLSGDTNKTVWIETGSIGNRTYTANWTPKSYTLSFDADGGEDKEDLLYNPNQTTALGSTTKTGYTFQCWKVTEIADEYDCNWEENVEYTAAQTVNLMYGTVTMTAQWQINEYELTINPNGGMYNGTTGTTKVKHDYQYELTISEVPTRTGYNFTGWSKTSGEGTYAPNANAATGGKFTYGAGDATIKAQWQVINYSITIDYGVGAGSVTNPTSYTYDDADITLNNPTANGWTFKGWTGSNGTSPQMTVKILHHSTGAKEYEAKWDAKTYTVTLDPVGGSNGTENVTATFASAMPAATMPEKNGYTFQGYYQNGSGQGTKYYNADGSSAHVWDQYPANNRATIYAYWTLASYTITYNLFGGSVTPANANPTTYTFTDEDIDLARPQRPGYNFAGWVGNGNAPATATLDYTITQGSYGNLTFDATWSAIPYTIKYYDDNGTTELTGLSPTVYYITDSDFTLPSPTRGGYTFAGWTGANGTAPTTADTSYTIARGSMGNRSFVAHWTPNSYTLSFDANSGVDKDPLDYNPDQTTQLGETTMEGYSFKEWKVTTADGNWTLNARYPKTKTVAGMYGNAELEAQWDINSYTLTVDPNGGRFAGSTNTTPYVREYLTQLPIGVATRDGYDFTGWTKTSGVGTYTPTAGHPEQGGKFTYGAGDATITAGWSPITYNITYTLNGGALEEGVTNPETYNIESADIPLNNPVKDGYTFLGWTGSNHATNPSTSVTIAHGSMGDKQYVANWQAKSYEVTLDKQSGTGGSNKVTATYDAAMPSASMPSRSGYVFNGYYEQTNGGGTQYYAANGASSHTWDQHPANGKATIYAYWTADSYKLTFNPNGGYFDKDDSNNTGGFDISTQNRTSPQYKYVTFAGHYNDAWNGKTWPAKVTRAGYSFTGWKNGGNKYEAGGTVSITEDTILTASWTANTFTLTFNMNNVTATAPDNMTLEYDAEYNYPAAPSGVQGGWSFRGWSETAGTTSGTVAEAGDPIDATTVNGWYRDALGSNNTKTLYAIWVKRLTGTFTDTTGDQTAYVDTYNGAANGTITAPTQRDCAGWTALGWAETSTAADATPSTASTFTISADTHYYGRYERTLTVTYEKNGGKTTPAATQVTQQMSAAASDTWTDPSVTLRGAIERDGYTFAGWKIDSTVYGEGGSYTITADKTAVAQWSLHTFAVTIDPALGTLSNNAIDGSVGSITYYRDDTVNTVTSGTINTPTTLTMVHSTTATIPLPVRNGYNFTGWTVSATNSGAAVPTDGVITNSTSGASTYKVGAEDVTLTAGWQAKKYTIVYASGRDATSVNDGSNYAYNANVTVKGADVLGRTYPGFTFVNWMASTDGDYYNAGASFTQNGKTYADTVTFTAQWQAIQYRIVYDLNGSTYTEDDIVSVSSPDQEEEWTWKTMADTTRLVKGNNSRSVKLYGAYSDGDYGQGSYFYLNTEDELRFGLSWSFKSTAELAANSALDPEDYTVPFFVYSEDDEAWVANTLKIGDIPDEVLASATRNGTATQYDIKLYMVWSANYKELEDEFMNFQSEYMVFEDIEDAEELSWVTVRDIRTDAPVSAKLPPVAAVDAAYKANGDRAKEVWPDTTDTQNHGRYGWVAGAIDDPDSWDSTDEDNYFTAATIGEVNDRYLEIVGYLVLDPYWQFFDGMILPQVDPGDPEDPEYVPLDQSYIDDLADELATAVTDPEAEGGMLSGLLLQDADLNYRLTDDDMDGFGYSDACAGTNSGMSYKPTQGTKTFIYDNFGERLADSYPVCESDTNADGTTGHHSFNSMVGAVNNAIGKANEIFSLFGFDPTQQRYDPNYYFRSGNTDENGFTINANCPYTTESVYILFDLIYGRRNNDGNYVSSVSADDGGINAGKEALYYQVKSTLGNNAQTLLKKPSQDKLNEIVAKIAYVYHGLEMKLADYGQDLDANSNEIKFANLFQKYFDATWGTKLGRENGGSFDLGTNYLSAYQGYFEETSYNALDRFLRDYFSEPGRLWPDGDGARDANGNRRSFPYYKGVEQKCVDGTSDDESKVREFDNSYIEAEDVDLSDFQFVKGTLCAQMCDLIDHLKPDTADYSEVFRLIARSVQRSTPNGTRYMVDYRNYADPADCAEYYPSTAADVNEVNDDDVIYYDVWWSHYADPDPEDPIYIWDNGTYDGHTAYDTEWLYRYYTADSVDDLGDVINYIWWSYNKLDQEYIDALDENGQYEEGTICYDLKYAIDHLVAKEFKVNFYKALSENPNDPQDYIGQVAFYPGSNGEEVKYYFGDTVTTTQTPNPDASLHKTFIGWNTMRNNDAGHNVSAANNYYRAVLPLDETLMETWWNGGTADITEQDGGATYLIKLYARYVDNVTLDVVMDGGTVEMALENEEPVIVTDAANNSPTYDYGTTLTFTNPAKTGYRFNRWNFDPGDNNSESTFVNGVYTFGYTRTLPKTNDTLTAEWTPNTYTVTFHKNDAAATGTMAPQTLTYDAAQTLTANAFELNGYTFEYWTRVADGSGDRYTDEQSVLNLTAAQGGNIDLYAHWKLANFKLTFDVGNGEWNGWPGETTPNANDNFKTITFGELYGMEDASGKTWPNNPKEFVQVIGNQTIRSKFLGWYTAANGGVCVDPATDTVEATEPEQTLYAHFNTTVTEETVDKVELVMEQMDANHYTMESMQAVDAVLMDILDSGREITQDDLNALKAAIDGLQEADESTYGDVKAPTVGVYENKAALRKAIESGEFVGDASDMLSEDAGEISYVWPGKAYYTYYCYTNSATPVIMMNSADIAGANGRVSYPTTFTLDKSMNTKGQPRTRTGFVNSGWMNYTTDADETVRKAGWDVRSNQIVNPYAYDAEEGTGLKYFGRDFSDGDYSTDKNYNYYTHQQYVLLKPQFDATSTRKQYALYTFKLNDDSCDQWAADTTSLAGAEGFGSYADPTALETYSEAVTPTGWVTIYVEYYNTMNGDRTDNQGQVTKNGVGACGTGGKLEVYNNFHENGYQNNQWVNVDYLYRNAAGATNDEFAKPLTLNAEGTYDYYIMNDPIFGQNTVGSFYYLMKSDDPATIKYWQEYDKYLAEHPDDPDKYHNARVAGATAGEEDANGQVTDTALLRIETQVKNDLMDPTSKVRDAILEQMENTWTQAAQVQNGAYIRWPYSSNTQWSTQFYAPARTREDTLVFVHVCDRWGNTYTNILQRDLQDTQAAQVSQIANGEVVVNEVGCSEIKDITITELNTQKKVQILNAPADGVWNWQGNQLMLTVPEGSNGYRYTMTITDNASNKYSFNFQAASDGSVWITVNDETMGGAYATTAAAPQTGTLAAPVIGASAIEEAALTTMSVEVVRPGETPIPQASLDMEQAVNVATEERPDLYTFTLNGTYTVNLFAESTRDYELTLKSTAGGTLKAYVNGEFTPPKSGKVTVPSGSRVKITVAPKTGYELESLTMIYPDGRTVNLVGAYNAQINDDVTIKAIFAETSTLLTVRVENGAVSGKQELFVSPYSRVTAVAAAAPAGKVFAYWSQNGADDVPVSYDEIYTFIVTSDVDLKANYSDTPAEQTASIVMDAANESAHVTVVNGTYSLSYSGKITVPEDAQIEEFGLVLTNQSGESCTADNLQIGQKINGVNVVKIPGQTLTEEGQCKININNVAAGQTRTGRLYMTVKFADGTTQTIYSGTWSELNTPAA